jgi:hypothetical protein
MSRVQSAGYEPQINVFSGEEGFAEGGVSETASNLEQDEQRRREEYFRNLRPFAPALTDQYRTDATRIGSVQGVDPYNRDPLTRLTQPAPRGVGTEGIASLQPYDESLAEWYRSLLVPPIGRAPLETGDYFTTTPKRGATNYGPVVKYPEVAPPPPPPPPPPPFTCPDGSEPDLTLLAQGLDPCGLIKRCPDGRLVPSGESCEPGDKTCPDGSLPDPVTGKCKGDDDGRCADGSLPDPVTGKCKGDGNKTKTCPDGSVIPVEQECGGGTDVITPETCTKLGLSYDADRAAVGLYPCVSVTKKCPPNSTLVGDECICNDNTTTPRSVAPADGCEIKETKPKCDPDTEYLDETGNCAKRCWDKSIPGPNGCPPQYSDEYCANLGLKYDPDLDAVGLYACVDVKTYKCDDGRIVRNLAECDKKREDEDCEWAGSTRDKDGVCRCADGSIPDPKFGCALPCDDDLPRNPETGQCPKKGSKPPLPNGKCPPGTKKDPVFGALGLTVCEPDEGGGGGGGGGNGGGEKEDKVKCKPHEAEFQGQCFQVCQEGETYDPDRASAGLNPCVKPEDENKPKCDADETQDGDICYGTCPDGSTYTRGVGGEKPCPKEPTEDNFKRCGGGVLVYKDDPCPEDTDPEYAARLACDLSGGTYDGSTQMCIPPGMCLGSFGELYPEGPNGCGYSYDNDPYAYRWGQYAAGGSVESTSEFSSPSDSIMGKFKMFGIPEMPKGLGSEDIRMMEIDPRYMASGGIVKKKRKKYQTGGIASLTRTPQGAAVNPADGYNFGFAQGGMPVMPEYRAGGKLLRGAGDGMSDDIPAVIRGKGVQRAALADGEFVIPADVVSHLGNGSTEAGAKKLYQMMARIRKARTGKSKQAPAVKVDKYLPR